MATIGDIVVNLSTNTQKFSRGLTGSLGGLRSFISKAAVIAAPLAGILGVGAAVGAAREQAKQERLLSQTLASTGNAAGMTAREIADYATELQKTTGIGDELTLSAAGILATFTKVNGTVFKDAIRLSQDLSVRLGTDLNGAAIQLGKALNDPARGMTALRRAGVSFTEQQQAQIKALQASGDLLGAQKVIIAELETEFAGAAAAAADPWEIAKAQISDAAEVMGFALLPAINIVAEAMTEMFGFIAGNRDESQSWGIEIAAFAENWRGIMKIAGLEATLAVVQFGNNVAHFFTEAMPAWLAWFGDNWQKVFFTAFDYASTIFINLGENIRNLFSEIWDFISSGGQNAIEFDWTPLLEGAKSTLGELPAIPERAIGDLEKTLMEDIDRLSANVGTSIAESIDKKTKSLSFTPKSFQPGTANGSDIATGKTVQGVKALQRGSSEAFSAIQAAIRSGNNQPINQVAKNTAVTAEEAPQQTAALQAIQAALEDSEVVGL